MKFFSISLLVLTQIIFLPSVVATESCIDNDGDGWGWNGSASCIADASSRASTLPANSSKSTGPSNTNVCLDPDGDGWGWDGSKTCVAGSNSQALNSTQNNSGSIIPPSSATCADPDGDGWGWDGTRTCIVGGSNQTSNSTSDDFAPITSSASAICVDPDGDGWGWDGSRSCIAGSTSPTATPTSNNSGSSKSSTQPVYQADDVGRCSYIDDLINNNEDMSRHVTDVILTAGQSNAAGNKTEYDPGAYAQDQKDSRLLAWTTKNKWEVADPTNQTWDLENRQPFWRNRPKQIHNHPAFQIGKGVLKENPCRVVGIIATAAAGEAIDYWLNNINNHYGAIQSKVSQALQALPNKSNIDMIWWMQGESDEGLATGSSGAYTIKLNQLIQRFKSNSWYAENSYFLANETRNRYRVNENIRNLGRDGYFNTDYSEGEVQPGQQNLYPSLENEIPLNVFVHFNDVALRRIGNNVARKYSAYKGF